MAVAVTDEDVGCDEHDDVVIVRNDDHTRTSVAISSPATSR